MVEVLDSTKAVVQPEAGAASRALVADNQVGVSAADAKNGKDATNTLVESKALPGVSIAGADGNSQAKPLEQTDVLRDADLAAVKEAKSKGVTNFDDAFYRNVSAKDGALPDFHVVDLKNSGAHFENAGAKLDNSGAKVENAGGRVTPPTDAHLRNSDRLVTKPDGSADVTVKPGDNLWRIAREALKQNKPEEFKPSNKDIDEAVRKLTQENHLRDANKIHPGQHIHIPKDMLAKPPEVQKPAEVKKQPEVPLENHNASPEFVAEVKKQFDSLPENVRKLLADSGAKLIVGGKNTDANPDLKDVHPRGWPPGKTWDDADGLYQPGKKEITVTETRHDSSTDKYVKNDRPEGVVKHETGHAVDAAMGSESHSDEFKAAYDKDVAAMPPADRETFKYLLQDGNAGHEETFAEVFGAMHGSSANSSQTQAILRDFPSVRALIQRKISELP